ncbi:MAG: hypothetical protein HY876_06870 [Coriobacteriales bacterium]|nr:hypothetical protein [Coriobacteriales bacterium]
MALDVQATILTEAGPSIGLGHLSRCVALYDALVAVGVETSLIVSGEAPVHVIGQRPVRDIPWQTPTQAALLAEGVDLAVVDSYIAPSDVYEAVRATVRLSVYLDDTARLAYPSGVVVNGNPRAADLGFDLRNAPRLLLGPRYQLLRSEFRNQAPRQVRDRVSRVLLVSGGSNIEDARERMAQAVADACPRAILDVVDSPRSALQMKRAMLECDVAVSAAGQTLYELAATGTPCIAVCVADNQVAQARAFEDAGALSLAGILGSEPVFDRIPALLEELEDPSARESMARAGQSLIDGEGAERVARYCVGLLEDQGREGESR